jgi:hypothetical protein
MLSKISRGIQKGANPKNVGSVTAAVRGFSAPEGGDELK